MPTSADKDDPYDMKFETLDLTGDQAVLKITDYVFGVWFVDYLSMLKTEDGWKIVNKTYYADKMPEAPEDAAKFLG